MPAQTEAIITANPSQSSGASSPVALWASRSLVLLALIVQIAVALRFWAITWDDSAITLGFARTLALTGRIEPTPGSGIVEGYSTTLWMLLMAAAAKLLPSPSALLTFAKLSTLVLNLANILFIRRWLSTWTTETLANLTAATVGCTLMFYETINGMETPLILTLVLVMLLLLPSRTSAGRIAYILAGSLLLLTRWEAAWLLVPFLLAEYDRRNLRRTLIPALSWAAVFVLSNLIRWHYFGHFLPNTIIAKQNPPYSFPGRRLALEQHLTEPLHILASMKVFLLLLAAFLLYRYFSAPQRTRLLQPLRESWQLRFTLLFTLFCLILSTAIGPNWGPPFRSFYPAWPFLIALLLLPVVPNLKPAALTFVTAALCLFTIGRMVARIQPLRSEKAPVYMPRITVNRVAVAAPILTNLQQLTHHSVLTYAAPDMGAVMLYTTNVHVIDLGLLCDPVLARQGFRAIQSYVLRQRQPDVIEVHEVFTETTNLAAYPEFLSDYRPVYIRGIRFFLRRNVLADIPAARLAEKPFLPNGHPQPSEAEAFRLSNAPYPDKPADYALNQLFRTYLVLN
ncbi:hypothetical protein [Edaphobacter aggregans]|uniref:hypothetical protein n=1 Tax=Edaphobacter aggregans TaxID=570835 RepID=UPI00054DF792|nr:hypothetical protein [Edaphobacter aggregans]